MNVKTERGAPVSRQQVFDSFSFLEGVVSEHYYKRIAETALTLINRGQQRGESFAALTLHKSGQIGLFADTVALRQKPITDDERRFYREQRGCELVEVFRAPIAPQPAEPAKADYPQTVARALESLDWSNVSFGHKAIIRQAVETLQRSAPQPADSISYGRQDEIAAMEAVMQNVDPATWPGLTVSQRCALGRFAKPQPAEPVKGELSIDDVADIVREHLTSTYVCNRVWDAWNVGTMSQDDFVDASETEMPDEIAAAILAHYQGAQPAESEPDQRARPAASAQQDALPVTEQEDEEWRRMEERNG